MTATLTLHFTLEELTVTSTGLDNQPPAEFAGRPLELATNLELVRAILGRRPITINSAFRSEAVNRAVGGARNSEHLSFRAADLICPSFGPPAACAVSLRAYSTVLNYNQLILENTWVHISFPPDGEKGKLECLTIYPGQPVQIGLVSRAGTIL